jgi:hypothetical protein
VSRTQYFVTTFVSRKIHFHDDPDAAAAASIVPSGGVLLASGGCQDLADPPDRQRPRALTGGRIEVRWVPLGQVGDYHTVPSIRLRVDHYAAHRGHPDIG